MKALNYLGAASAVLLAGTVSASAVTMLSSADVTITDIQTVSPVVDLTDEAAVVDTVSPDVFFDVVGDQSQKRDVYENTDLDGIGTYTAVQGEDPFSAGTLRYEFGTLRSTLELLWGSPDDFNYITFFQGAEAVAEITGQALIDLGATAAEGAYYTSIVYAGLFDAVEMESRNGRDAFEFDGVAAVPLPAGVLLLGGALAGLGLARRRKS